MVTRNLFKSQPWEKQANNQSNCKIEFPASRKAGVGITPISHRACRISPTPSLSLESRRLRSEVVKGRRGNFCANVMVYSRAEDFVRGDVNKVRPWLKNIRRCRASVGDSVVLPANYLAIFAMSSFRSFILRIADFAIYHQRRYGNVNCRNIIFFCSILHDDLLSHQLPYRGKSVWTSFAVILHSTMYKHTRMKSY